jgi:uncharacterized HAD superfamily protein
MKIAVDIDGVLLDIIITYCEIYNTKYKTNYSKKDVTDWDFFKYWGVSEEEAFDIFFQIYENSMSVPFIDSEAPFYMKKLNKSHEVYILSARTSQFRTQIIEKLNFHNIRKGTHYKELILVRHKPYDLKHRYEFDLYIDDNPHLAERIKSMDRYLLLYDQPWNRNYICKDNIIRVHNWKEVYKTINSLNSHF